MRFAVLLVVIVVVVAVAPAPTGGVQSAPDADNTVTRIDVRADGDARWTVTIRTRLRTEADVADYRAFQDRFRENTSRYLDPFRSRISTVVSGAANTTGREMAVENITASTRIQQVPRRWGVVSYEFTWTAFAQTNGRTVTVGDVFIGGFFIAENDTLVVSGPAGYEVTSVEPAPATTDNDTVRYVGRRDFDDGRPQVQFAPATTATHGIADADSGSGLPLAALAVAGVVLLVGIGGLVYARREHDDATGTAPPMTDADRAVELVLEHGGQMKQAELADALDWSASKTSRVVSELAEEGRVEKLRIGRENLISVPDDEL